MTCGYDTYNNIELDLFFLKVSAEYLVQKR